MLLWISSSVYAPYTKLDVDMYMLSYLDLLITEHIVGGDTRLSGICELAPNQAPCDDVNITVWMHVTRAETYKQILSYGIIYVIIYRWLIW